MVEGESIMAYNITFNLSKINSTSGIAYFSSINNTLNYYPVYLFLLLVWFGIFTLYVNNSISKALVTASSVITGLSAIFFVGGMLPGTMIIIPVSLLILSLVLLAFGVGE